MGRTAGFHGRIDSAAIVIDRVAGGLLGAITLLMFVSAIMRYLFAIPIPDSYDIGRLLLGCCVLWGLSSVSFHGKHIVVDMLWTALSPRWRSLLDIFASAVTFGFLTLLAWMLFVKVIGTYSSNEQTFDLRLLIWPFYLLAWCGLAVSVLMTAARIVLLCRGTPPELSSEYSENEGL